MRREEYSPEHVIAALESTGGIITAAAMKLNCTAQTIRNYRDRYPEVAAAIVEIREGNLDLAETKLLKNIKDGKEASIFFYLKTMGKDRGFVERSEHTGKGGKDLMPPATIDTSKLDTATLRALRAAQVDPDAAADAE